MAEQTGETNWGNPLQGIGQYIGERLQGALRSAVLAAVSAGLVLPAGPFAMAAPRVVAQIDGFGPYKLGMTLKQAKAADAGGKQGPCGEIAEDRECLVLKAEVFQEPGVIYAVLDQAGTRVERVVAELDPQLTRRRAYRCVRLSEKVFALLVVVYGSRYKQSYDENGRPLPAVAWDGEESGRLIFEAQCRTHDEGNPTIRVVERYPDGVKPPPVASVPEKAPATAAAVSEQANPASTVEATAAAGNVPLTVENETIEPSTQAGKSSNLALTPRSDLPPPPVSAPIGIVEESALGAPDTSGSIDASDRMTLLTRELAHAKGKAEAAPIESAAQQSVPPISPLAQSRSADEAFNSTAETTEATETGAPATTAPSGDPYTLPLDIAPPPADAAQAGHQTIAIGEAPTDAAKPASETASAPASPVIADPGPVTLPNAATTAIPPAQPVIAEGRPSAVPTPVSDLERAVATAPVALPKVSEAEKARRAVAETRPAQQPAAAPPSDVERTTRGESALNRTARRPAIADVPAPTDVAGASAASGAKSPSVPPPFRTASLPPPVRPPSYREAYEPPEPTDLEAPEPLAMPEEEETFRRQRDEGDGGPAAVTADTKIEAAVQQRFASAPAPENSARAATPAADERSGASAAPVSLLSVARESATQRGAVASQRSEGATAYRAPDRAAAETASASSVQPGPVRPEPSLEPAPKAAALTETADNPVQEEPAATAAADNEAASVENPFGGGWGDAKNRGFAPVMSGGWRHKAPVPPVRPWRERTAIPPVPGSDA